MLLTWYFSVFSQYKDHRKRSQDSMKKSIKREPSLHLLVKLIWSVSRPALGSSSVAQTLLCGCSVTLQQFDYEGLIHPVSPEQLMLRWVCHLNSVKHLFGLQFLRLVTLMNLSSAMNLSYASSFHVAILMRASLIVTLDSFCDCT